MSIDDDGACALAAGLAILPSLKKLYLSDNSIGDQGLQLLGGCLARCNLEELRLARNIFALSGLESLGNLLKRAARLTSLFLGGNNIDDDGLQYLVEGMTQHCSLNHLDLAYNHSITAVGLRSFAPFFQSDNCCLDELGLWGINFGDEGAAALANGLVGNESLTTLKFNSPDITAVGWTAFSRLLCDNSSVNDIYFSNHTLTKIGGYGYGMNSIPSAIVEYLKLNNLLNYDAGFCKILNNHPDIDIEPLFEWKLKFLPLIVTWFEKAKPHLDNVNESAGTFQCRQLSAVYKFVRGMPLLTVAGYRGKNMTDIHSKSKKRKLDQTL